MKTKCLLASIVLAAAAFASPASASYHNAPYKFIDEQTGIKLASLVHGQMVALAAHRSEIILLAQQVAPYDDTAVLLRTYIGDQYKACAYGLVPLSIADTESPFHVCTHAYLAATRALLFRLEQYAPSTVVQQLATTVENEMLAGGAALELCANSDTSFDTAHLVKPHWNDLPHYLHEKGAANAALVILLGFVTLLGGLTLRRKRRVTVTA